MNAATLNPLKPNLRCSNFYASKKRGRNSEILQDAGFGLFHPCLDGVIEHTFSAGGVFHLGSNKLISHVTAMAACSLPRVLAKRYCTSKR